MATETTNLHLVKPAQSEKYNVDVFNGNADILDNAYANMSSEMSQQNTNLQNLINERIADHNSLRTSLDDTNTVHPYIQAKIQDNTSAIEVLQQEIADIEAGQVEGVQSDWLQNNTSKINYIKNKPFYDEYLTNDIIPYSTIDWDGEPVESEGSYTRTATYTVSTPMVANTDYLITINGSEYKFTTPSEEPFEYSFVEGDYIYRIAQSGTTITFTEISTSAETMANLFGLGIISQVITHQIDEKYMPDYYSILKQRCDTNAVDKMGVVPAPTASKARYFYSTDSNGSPAWRNTVIVAGATATADGTAGLVPAPQSSRYSDRGRYYLAETGTWRIPPTFTKATATTDGNVGFVPAPSAGDQAKFLKADGTWSEPTNTWTANTVTTAGYVAAPTASKDYYFYSTDGNGTPAWRNNITATRARTGLMDEETYRTLFNYASASTTDRTHQERMFWGTNASGTPGWYNYIATTSAPGWMSAADKLKLDRLLTPTVPSGSIFQEFAYNGQKFLYASVQSQSLDLSHTSTSPGWYYGDFTVNISKHNLKGIYMALANITGHRTAVYQITPYDHTENANGIYQTQTFRVFACSNSAATVNLSLAILIIGFYTP